MEKIENFNKHLNAEERAMIIPEGSHGCHLPLVSLRANGIGAALSDLSGLHKDAGL